MAGIGFVFLGIAYIKTGFDSYKEALDFTRYNIAGFKGMLMFFVVGTMATLIMQSTHATLVLIMAALSTGQLGLEAGMALSIGAQFGSSITTGLGALNASIDGKRLAVAHISFNLITVLIAVILYEPFLWATNISSNALGIENINLKVAMFLTIFNVLRIGLMIPFLKKFVYYLVRFIKERKSGDLDSPIYLDESKVEFANASLEAIRNETKHLYDNALGIISRSIGFDRERIRSFEPIENLLKNKKRLKDEIDIDSLYESKVNALSNAIMEFTARAKTRMGNENQMKEVFALQMSGKCIVEATQQMRLVQKNLQKHSLSRNESLSNEYNQMRGTMANLLRAMEELRITDIEENMQVAKNKIAKYKAFFNYDDFDIINKIDALVSSKSISIAESTSMLNDLSFMRQIALSLVEAIGYLYGVKI